MATATPWEDRLQQSHLRLQHLAASLVGGEAENLKDAIGGGSVLDPESGDLAQAMTDQHTQVSLAIVFDGSRAQVEHALERLQAGLYGRCEDCDAEIPEERLAFRPESTRCVPCQGRHERMHRGAA